MQTQVSTFHALQATQPDSYNNPRDASPKQAPFSSCHVHIVVNNGLVHVHGEDNSAAQQAAVIQAVYDLIGITDCVPVPSSATSLSPTEICATIKEALHRVPELDVQQVQVELQDGALVLHGLTAGS
jgi:osmotically-inducible protein OsmY